MDFPIQDIFGGSTLGIIGYGELAKGVEQIGQSLRDEGADRGTAARANMFWISARSRVAFDEVLRKMSDIVTLHCAAQPGVTRQLVGSTELSKMRPHFTLF